jgi:hypothetical protein
MEDPLSTSSYPQSPRNPAGRAQPSTQEIPVVQPTGATATQQVTADGAPQPTGPVDFVPGLPGVGTLPPPPPPVHATAAPPPPVPATGPQPAAAPGPATSAPQSLEDRLLAGGQGTAKKRRTRGKLDRKALAGLLLAALSVVLLELGLTLGFGGKSYWSTVTLWSAFATVAAALGLLAFAAFYPAGNRSRSGPAWRVAAAGVVGLAVFWLLVVLPDADTDRGFLLTAALGCLGVALWIGPRPKG